MEHFTIYGFYLKISSFFATHSVFKRRRIDESASQNMMRRLLCLILSTIVAAQQMTERVPLEGPSEDFLDRGHDGSYKFGYKNLNYGSHFHTATATRDNTVSGSFGSRDPANQRIVQTTYTAGSRGFRARGPNVARQMDLSQTKIPYQAPLNSPDYQPTYNSYHDPNEDPSYKFALRTPTYTRGETADSKGTVNGAFSYVDDVGKRHDVKYEAGSKTGFLVKTAFPDSEPYDGLFYRGPNKPGTPPRGHSSIVQGTDGSYQFTATGPDQKRTEVSDSGGRVRGSYTYIDDRGVQRTVQYVAGPNIGYKVIRKNNGPVYSPVYPFPPTKFLVPPLPPESVLSPTTTTPSNDSFKISSDGMDTSTPNDKSSDRGDDFLNPVTPTTTSSYFPSSDDRPMYWEPSYTTLRPPKPDAPDFFTRLNTNGPTDTRNPQLSPYDDIFGDKSNDYDKPHSTVEGSHKAGKRPYSYPKPNKNLNEEPLKTLFGRNDARFSDTSRNFLGLPPGVVVRAHVQSLDILPYGSKVPPPEETLQKHLLNELDRNRYEYFTDDECVYVRKLKT